MQEQWQKAKKWSGELLVRVMGFERPCSLCLLMCHFTLHFLELAPDFWLVESGQWLITSLASSPLYQVMHLGLFTREWKPLFQGFFCCSFFLFFLHQCSLELENACIPQIESSSLYSRSYSSGCWKQNTIFTCGMLLCSKSTTCDNTDSSKAYMGQFFLMQSIL